MTSELKQKANQIKKEHMVAKKCIVKDQVDKWRSLKERVIKEIKANDSIM